MSTNRSPEDDGVPALDENPHERPSDDEEPIFPDRPLAAHDRVAASEQRERETLRTRVAREVPEEPQHVAERSPGRFYEETDDGRDVTGEVEATETGDRSALSAEEAAVTIREDPERDERFNEEAPA